MKKEPKIYGFALIILIVLLLPGALLHFRPSEAFAKEAAFIGVVIAFTFWPFYKYVANKSNKGTLRRVFTAFVVIPLGVSLFGYGASVGSVGFALNRIVGTNNVISHTIERKGCTRRRCLCSTKIYLSSDSTMSTGGEFCVKELFWKRVEVGQQLRLSGVSSRFGFDVDKFEVVR